jgi:hypothetical protein
MAMTDIHERIMQDREAEMLALLGDSEYECKTLGDGYIVKDLKNGEIFSGTFAEWKHFKKHHLEMLNTDDLLNNCV